ncbi:MAG: molybdopterin-dependent oxidoreductase [Myxococcota bacterium]
MAGTPTRTVAKKRWTRRDLLKLGQVAGVGAATVGLATLGRPSAGEEVRTGTCRLCTMHCGVVATVRGGRLVRLDGDLKSSTHGFICLNGQGMKEVLSSGARLKTPLIRRGDRFEPADYAEAIDAIARRLTAIKDKYGAASIAVETGWPFVRHTLVPYLERFCHALGTPNLATVASLCEASGRMGRGLAHGSNYWPIMGKAKTLVIWGTNPAHSAAPYYHQVLAAAKSPRALVVIDPVRTEVAAHATHHLSIRPGTDGALALGFLRQLFDRGRVNVDSEEMTALEEATRPYDPGMVEQSCSIPAAQFLAVAELIATNGPTAIWDGLGVEHHENGVQTVRAISTLYSLAGGLEETAEARPAEIEWVTPEPMPPRPQQPPIGAAEFPVFQAFQRQAQKQRFPVAIEKGELRAMILLASNAALTAPGSARLAAALEKLELLVVIDPFLTPTGERADVVLPARTFAETSPLELPTGEHLLGDDQIMFQLARALGLSKYFPWESLEEAERGNRRQRPLPGPRKLDRSTLVIRSSLLQEAGQPALLDWKAPTDAPTPEFPLILVSGPRTRAFINSGLHHAPSVVSKMPRPLARLHPETARVRGIQEGDAVLVRTSSGQAQFHAELTPDVHPEVVVVPHGWAEGNANLLTDVEHLDPISGFPAFRSRACAVQKV